MHSGLLTHVLLIEDSERDAELIVDRLLECHRNFVIYRVESEADLRCQLDTQSWDLVLSDHNLPGMNSIRALEVLSEYQLKEELPFIIVSGRIGEEAAVKLMRSGARDYVSKQCLDRLVPVIDSVLNEHQLRMEKAASEKKLAEVCKQLQESNDKLKQALHTVTQAQESLVKVERFKSLGEMSGGIAHDFNNVLTKVLGVVEGMQQRMPGVEAEAFSQLRTLITDGAAIIRRLRDFYATRSQERVATPVDLNELVRETVQLTKPKWQNDLHYEGRAIRVVEDLRENPWVSVDPSHLREVLTNLIFNACDAMSQGGELRLLTSQDDSMSVIEIRDTGSGMSEEVRQRCLEPFFTTKGEAGTGLGLALAANVIRGFGGVLDIESELGKGTSIFIRLPLCLEGPCCVLSEEGQEEEHCPELSVLVVDDDPLIASILCQYLKLEGHKVKSILCPHQALEALTEHPFDVVITDRSMPVMSGDELSSRIKQVYPQLPVIMATGYGDLMMVNGDAPAEVDYVLPKPISREDLYRGLVAVTSDRRPMREAA